MKITIEHYSLTSILEDKDVDIIDDVMILIRHSLLALGFHPKSILKGCQYLLEEYGDENES